MYSLYQSVGVTDAIEWACVLCGHRIHSDWAHRAANLHHKFALSLSIPLGNYSDDSEGCAKGNRWLAASPAQHACSCITSMQSCLVKIQITQVTQSPYSLDLAPWDFWLYPNIKSPLKGKRFQAVSEIQENTMRQLMVIGRTVWGPKMPTLKGTEVSLSYV